MIVFCHLLNDRSGSPIVLGDAIRALAREGDEHILFIGSQGRGALETAGIPIRRYWYRRSRFRLLTLFTYAVSQLCLYRALSKSRLPSDAVIYVNTLLPFGAALWARRNGRRLIYHIHEVSISPHCLQRFLVGVLERTAERVLYVSEDNRARLPIASVPAAVVSNPVTPRIAEKACATSYAPRRSGRFDVLMVASPRDFKGVPEFLDLARRVAVRPDIHFTLVLNGGAAEIAQYLARYSPPENVEVHARCETPELFYARADVLLNLSRVDQWIETFGLSIVEGMAFGLPAIVPPIGGPTEILTEGREGYFVDSRDGALVEQRLLQLADVPQIAQEMSDAARYRALDFTIEHFAAALGAQIDLLIAGNYNKKV